MADNKNLEKKEVAKKKSDKPNLWQKIKKFFREYKSELKKISWPTLPEVIKNSLVTIVVVLIVGLFIWVVDTGLTLGRDAILGISDKSSSQTSDDIIDSSAALVEALKAEGFDTVAVSASEVISGADASASDVYVITLNGERVEGFENYIASTAEDAETMLISYALALDAANASNTDVTSAADVSTADTSATDAE